MDGAGCLLIYQTADMNYELLRFFFGDGRYQGWMLTVFSRNRRLVLRGFDFLPVRIIFYWRTMVTVKFGFG